jgi:hypothetical protein
MRITTEIISVSLETHKDETKRSSMLDQNLYFQISLLRQEYTDTVRSNIYIWRIYSYYY